MRKLAIVNKDRLPFYGDCVGFSNVDVLNAIKDDAKTIPWKEFKENTLWEEYKSQIFCGRKIDNTVNFWKTPNWDIYFFTWSGIEHIFADTKTIDLLEQVVEKFNQEEHDEFFNPENIPQSSAKAFINA